MAPQLFDSCLHEKWQARIVPRSDGVKTLREFCNSCGVSSSGTRMGYALPMVADNDVSIPSFKYPGKTLGEIFKIDPGYLQWIVKESKTSDRVRKSAARILCGVSYTPPKDKEIYGRELCYVPTFGWRCVEKIKSSP